MRPRGTETPVCGCGAVKIGLSPASNGRLVVALRP
jgi:hypothetical protein